MEPPNEAKQPDLGIENPAKQLAVAAQNAQIERMIAAFQKANQLLERHLAAGEQTVPARALHAILHDAWYGQEQNQGIRQVPQQLVEPAAMIRKLEQFPNRFEVERIRAETRLSVHDGRVQAMTPIGRWWNRQELTTGRQHLINEVTRTRDMAELAREVAEQLSPVVSQNSRQEAVIQRLNQFPNHFEGERIRAKERLNMHDQRVHNMSPISRWWHGRELTVARQHLLNDVVRTRHTAALARQFADELRPAISQKPKQETIVNVQQQAMKQQQEIKPGQPGMRV